MRRKAASRETQREVVEAIALGMPGCPNCGGRNVRPSYSSGFWDGLRAAAGYSAYRCRACQHRFFRRPPRGAPAPE